MNLTVIQQICISIIPILFAITLHEVAHGWCAYKLGDPTAKLLGRITINPIPHIDPIGTIAVPLVLGYMTNFQMIFGWAKPVPISPANFKNLRRDNALVAVAGPMANLLMALFWALCLKIVLMNHIEGSNVLQFLGYSARIGVLINIVLIALNILPIPPLDGSKVVSSLLPPKYAYHYDKVEPYGFLILMLLMVTNLLQYFLYPIMAVLLQFIGVLFG